MKGYALEIKLIEWRCSCKAHENGCNSKRPHKVTTLTEVYNGSFGHNVDSQEKAQEKFSKLMLTVMPTEARKP